MPIRRIVPPPLDLRPLQAQDALRSGIGVDDPAVRSDFRNPERCQVQEAAQPLFAGPQRFFSAPPLCHIQAKARNAGGLTFGISNDAGACENPMLASIRPEVSVFDLVRRFTR